MTRRGRYIGMWFLLLFSIQFATAQSPSTKAKTPSSTPFPQSKPSTPNALRWEEMAFDLPVWSKSADAAPETFCIFRNNAWGSNQLHQMAIAHNGKKFKWEYHSMGSPEWRNQLALIHYSLWLNQKNKFSLGIGTAWKSGIATETPTTVAPITIAQPAIQGNYIHQSPRSGSLIISLRGAITPQSIQPERWLLGTSNPLPMPPGFEHRYLWNTAQCIWLGSAKKQKHDTSLPTEKGTWETLQPFVSFTQSPQTNFLEAGLCFSHTKSWSLLGALNTSSKPLRVGIYKYNQSWKAGMEVQWHQQLGWLGALQCRYVWQ
jgi:hypothetical protein